MSGAEISLAVVGAVASIITISEAVKEIYDTAKDPNHLHPAFHAAMKELPLITNTLKDAQSNLEQALSNSTTTDIEGVFQMCEDNVKSIQKIINAHIPNSHKLHRRILSVFTIGREGKKVNKLVKQIMRDLLLLGFEEDHIRSTTAAQPEQMEMAATPNHGLQEAEQVANNSGSGSRVVNPAPTIVQSAPNHELQGAGQVANNSGSGSRVINPAPTIVQSAPNHGVQEAGRVTSNSGSGSQTTNQTSGHNVAQGSARQFNSGGGSMTLGVINTNFIQMNPGNQRQPRRKAYLPQLYPINPNTDRNALLQKKGSRVGGTCEWIKSHPVYESWFRSTTSQLLWLSGGPGTGKTMLSIFLAEELERPTGRPQGTYFLQYFCHNNDANHNTASATIRSLTRQLLEQNLSLVDYLPNHVAYKQDLLSDNSYFFTLWSTFEEMVKLSISQQHKIYCIIDGIDECNGNSADKILNQFTNLISMVRTQSPGNNFNLILVSRDHQTSIRTSLKGFPRIQLDADAKSEVDKDIELFIDQKVDELSREKHYPKPLQLRVKKIFRERAEVRFLWIGIVAKELLKYKATETDKVLELFPPGLDKLYDRMLLQFTSGEMAEEIIEDRRKALSVILPWVALAVRPLTVTELSAAFGNDENLRNGFTPDEYIRSEISSCGYFLSIQQNKVTLIHQSAKDYLLGETENSNPELEVFRVKKQETNLKIAQKCFDYFQQPGALPSDFVRLNGDQKDTSHLNKFPLLSYAILHWHEHSRSLPSSEDMFNLKQAFYQENSLLRASFLKTYWAAMFPAQQSPPDNFKLLHFASFFGICPLVENILNLGRLTETRQHPINEKDTDNVTPLCYAARDGNPRLVQLLLNENPELEARDSRQQTALFWAAKYGNKEAVDLLSANGANIEARDIDGRTALCWAAEAGHKSTVQLLLARGANADVKDLEGKTLMHLATDSRQKEVVSLLLKKGADIRAKCSKGTTALHQAAKNGHRSLMGQLLLKGADIAAGCDFGNTALHVAAAEGHNETMLLLLKSKADIEARDYIGETPLHKAAANNHALALNTLLDSEADIQATDETGDTALHFAARRGHKEIVQLLLERGADMTALNNNKTTPLQLAMYMGHDTLFSQYGIDGHDQQ